MSPCTVRSCATLLNLSSTDLMADVTFGDSDSGSSEDERDFLMVKASLLLIPVIVKVVSFSPIPTIVRVSLQLISATRIRARAVQMTA